VLDWALSHRRKVVGIALAAFALSGVVASRLGSEFLPELNEGTTWINFALSPNVSTEEAARILRMARKALLTVPEVHTTVSKAGQPKTAPTPRPSAWPRSSST
jgi:cobalt-zinc-cadmium resistance protein CzcA